MPECRAAPEVSGCRGARRRKSRREGHVAIVVAEVSRCRDGRNGSSPGVRKNDGELLVVGGVGPIGRRGHAGKAVTSAVRNIVRRLPRQPAVRRHAVADVARQRDL